MTESGESEGRILVADDERLSRMTLEVQFRDEGLEVRTAANGFEALAILEREDVDVVITDLRMPSMDGLELLRAVRERWPDTAVLLITGYGTVATAVEAMQRGAADYLTKPVRPDELMIRVRRLLEQRRQREEIRRLRADTALWRAAGDMVFHSAPMRAAVERALAVARADVTVLLEGETGTGKQVFARLIHQNSDRSSGPFVTVSCAQLNANLVESELFGHEAGAFTGAARQRRGRFEAADGGTLLVDEVDDLPREVQVRLLMFLQDRTFERVGSSKTIRSDVRILCATKAPLGELVKAGRFREDLYYRINTISICIPPLRKRPEDIMALAEHFLRRLAERRGMDHPPEVAPEVLHALLDHDWPGNVRELEHALEHAITFAHSGPVQLEHLPAHLQRPSAPRLVSLHIAPEDTVSHAEVMAACERDLLSWALARTGGNQVQAARLLGMSRTTLRGRLEALRMGASASESVPEVPATEGEPVTGGRQGSAPG